MGLPRPPPRPPTPLAPGVTISKNSSRAGSAPWRLCGVRTPTPAPWTFPRSRFGALPPDWRSPLSPGGAKPGPAGGASWRTSPRARASALPTPISPGVLRLTRRSSVSRCGRRSPAAIRSGGPLLPRPSPSRRCRSCTNAASGWCHHPAVWRRPLAPPERPPGPPMAPGSDRHAAPPSST